MKHVLATLALLSLVIGCLTAQAVWDEELILREDHCLDWTRSMVGTPDGGSLVVFTQGGANHRGVWLRKIEADDQAAAAPILIYEDDTIKNDLAICSSLDGNFFIRWTNPTSGFGVTKVNSLGQPLWQPAVLVLPLEAYAGAITVPDAGGGLYLVYSKNVPGYSTDIFVQHINSAGVPLWQGEGLHLTFTMSQEDPYTAKITSDGGLIICYSIINNSYRNYKIVKIRADHTVAWTYAFTNDSTDPYTWVRSIFSPDNTTFYIIWTQTVNGVAKLMMQSFILNGALQFPLPVILCSTETSGAIYSSTVLCSDNTIMTGIHLGSNTLPITNHLQKNSLSGELLWSDVSPIPDSIISMYSLAADQAGGAYFNYIYMRGYSTSYHGSMVQHYDSAGQPLFPGIGKVVNPYMNYDETLDQALIYANNKFTGVWFSSIGDQKGLYYYVCDANADPLTPLKTPLREVIGGTVTYPGMIARGTDILTFWIDSRSVRPTVSAYKCYYQITDPEGNNAKAPDGEVLIDDANSLSGRIIPVTLANGETRLIYTIYSSSSPRLMVQSLDAEGNVAWGANGITLINPQYSANIGNICAFADENDLYLAWSMYDTEGVTRTYAQKLVGTTPMWGTNGLMISSGITGNHLGETPLVFKDHYLALKVSTISPGRIVCWAIHLEPDGSVSPAWQPAGMTVDDTPIPAGSSYTAVAGVAFDKLLIAYRFCFEEETAPYRYSLLDELGQTLIDHATLISDENIQAGLSFDTRLCFDYAGRIIDWNTFELSYIYGSLDENGLPTLDYNTVETDHAYASNNPTITTLVPNLHAIFWLNSSDIYMGMINPDGQYFPLANDDPVITKCKIAPLSAVIDGDLYLCWGDYKSSIFSYYGTELRLQRYAFSPVSALDPEAPPLAPRLTCYPNPFNPLTNIAFEMPTPGKALLNVYNLRGQLVTTLLDTTLDSGKQRVTWNGKDASGRDAASGIYFIRLSTPTSRLTTKALLLK